jgi:hypothetical protein
MDELKLEFFRKLREMGVVRYEQNGEVVVFTQKVPDMLEPRPTHLRPSVKLGQDGLSAEEQKAMYGRVYDAEE